jgi:hypothetical protein
MESRLQQTRCDLSAVPLRQEQVDAANQIQVRLPNWRVSESVLRNVASLLPNNADLVHVIPKAVALNSLYNTNVLAIIKMAKHIVAVFEPNPCRNDVGVVEKLANVEGIGRRFLSFASKYCHFFVDSKRFAILDSFAGIALAFHLGIGKNWNLKKTPTNYENYIGAIERLRQNNNLHCSYAELDRYLWLMGKRLWFKGRAGNVTKPPINGEVMQLFSQSQDPDLSKLIDKAFGKPTI